MPPENLASRLEAFLPPELVRFLRRAGEIAAAQGTGFYLVGGAVRDLLLKLTTLDLDLVVEGDAVALAKQFAELNQAKITIHPHFGTAKLRWKGWSIDLATARSETYARPGALPTVKPSTIEDDLFRRDFTINAMAMYLAPDRFGEVLDRYGGQADLANGLIRILHEKSFIDDATRIWRAVRYEQRLDFQLEQTTLELLKRDIPMLDTISADRIRYEVECVLQEKYPEKAFRRAAELGVLSRLHPALTGNGWLAARFEQAREVSSPDRPHPGIYLALLTYRLTDEETEDFISRLNLSRSIARILRDAQRLKARLDSLADPDLPASAIYHLLSGFSPQALISVQIASDSPGASRTISLFLRQLRYAKPQLAGDDLMRLGVKKGSDIGTLLELLREAKLDGKLASREDEERFVQRWLSRRESEAPEPRAL